MLRSEGILSEGAAPGIERTLTSRTKDEETETENQQDQYRDDRLTLEGHSQASRQQHGEQSSGRPGRDAAPYQIEKGGIFSLDGVHPTTMGYMLVAHLFLTRMKKEGALPKKVELPWKELVDADTLAKDPPALLVNLQECLANLEEHWGLSQLLNDAF